MYNLLALPVLLSSLVVFNAVTALQTVNSTFGVIETSSTFQIDSGGGFSFAVSKSNADIVSLKHNSIEYQDLTGPHVCFAVRRILNDIEQSNGLCRGRNTTPDLSPQW